MTKLLFINKCILVALLFLFGCSPTEPENVHGCLDSQACNYNSNATIDNNSCWYANEGCDCNDDEGSLIDECGICDTDISNDNESCIDCNGNPNGNYVIDNCGNCYPFEYLDYDCNHISFLQDLIDLNNLNILPLEWDETHYGRDVWSDGNLITLALRGQISMIPESIGNLTHLEHFHIDESPITIIPENVVLLENLTYLAIYDSQVTYIPESIGQLNSLNELTIQGLNISSVPESIFSITSLSTLDLANNGLIQEIPDRIGDLINLNSLYLWGNNLTFLPESICNIDSSCLISISSNNLCEEFHYDCIDFWGSQDQSNCCEGPENLIPDDYWETFDFWLSFGVDSLDAHVATSDQTGFSYTDWLNWTNCD